MTKKELQAALNARGIHNDYEFFGPQPYLHERTPSLRSVIPRTWLITKLGEALGTAWYDYGSKSIQKREDAEKWIKAAFGIEKLAWSPFHAMGDAKFIRARTKELLALPLVTK